jgi:putative aldouronate transport system substrate-binding protein
MRKNCLRIVAAVAGIAMVSALGGCGAGTSSSSPGGSPGKVVVGEDVSVGAMKDYKADTTFKATEPLTFTILYSDHPNYPLKADWLLWQKITELTNVTLDATIVPMSDYGQKRSLLIGAGDAPLIIPKTYAGQETPFVAAGAVLPVSDYVDLMPNFQKKVKDWGLEGEIDALRQVDGKYYVLPGLHEEIWPDYTLAVRTDIFEKQGIEIPKTWDELKSALEKLKAAYPSSIPFSDRYHANAVLNIAATSFGTTAGWGLTNGLRFDRDADKFVYAAAQPKFKQLLEYFNSLVKAGLMDPESFTQEDDQAIQKLVSGKSFVITANSQDIPAYRKALDEALGADKYSIKKITVPSGPAGDIMGGTRLENGVMIIAKAAQSKNFVAMMQFIDWLYYSDEGQEFAKWGVKGITYEKSADGVRKLAPDVDYNGLNPAGTKNLRIDYGFSGGVFAYGGTTDLLQSMMSPEEIEFQKAMKAKTLEPFAPPAPLADADREQATLLATPLKDYADQATLQFILGQRDLSEFDAFVAELEGKGMTRYTDMFNKAYTEFKS